ncbi:ankyrin repeat domain-containing protein SOWAHA [Amia ocellicauda]|uniref:ankyrin repeat domain-containing protein SOWAHA n=1 Tax=Amia ocellicauda TaxID=2972642 RepID=UPI003463A9C9
MAFCLTQEAVLTFLLERGGKAKNSDLLNQFKSLLSGSDPDEKKKNRDLFKRFVNTVAVVKEIEDVKYIVIKKPYQHLVKEEDTPVPAVGGRSAGSSRTDPGGAGKTLTCDFDNNNVVATLPSTTADCRNKNTSQSLIELALQRSRAVCVNANAIDVGVSSLTDPQDQASKVKGRSEEVRRTPADKARSVFALVAMPDCSSSQPHLQPGHFKWDGVPSPAGAQKPVQKPYMLPLRVPPPQISVTAAEVETATEGSPRKETEHFRSPRTKRRQTQEAAPQPSPNLNRGSKTLKPGDELKGSGAVPLDSMEHEWLVKSAAGHWNQVYGLLLKDTTLAEKRDFMSGFTALHWAAKSGNGDMVCKIIEISKAGGNKVDVNIKTYGGYTPLHMAAIHCHEYVMKVLVQDYGANPRIRDNSGRKPYHYLHKGVSLEIRVLLGEPQGTLQEAVHPRREDDTFQELPRAFKSHTLSRLFNPYSGYKKKQVRQRPAFYSTYEEQEEEREERRSIRPMSDVFQ